MIMGTTKFNLSTGSSEPVTHTPPVPHDVEAEQALLGALMLDNQLFYQVDDSIHAAHFYVPFHRKTYDAISRLLAQNLEASPITLRSAFKGDPNFTEIDLLQHFTAMLDHASYNRDVAGLARIIQQQFLKRQILIVGQDLSQAVSSSESIAQVQSLIDKASEDLFQLSEKSVSEYAAQSTSHHVEKAVWLILEAKKTGKARGLATGIQNLDQQVGNLRKSDLIILAARPNVGKTALSLNIAQNIAARDVAVGFFSLEMSAVELTNRLLSHMSKISADKLERGAINDLELSQIMTSVQKLQSIPLYIDDTAELPISSLRARARHMKRQHDIQVLFVDYLQLLKGSTGKWDNRNQEVAEISRGLKTIAKELEIPVVACTQLNRAVESRANSQPQLSDLRDSGAIEQDADIVMFLHRDKPTGADQKPDPNVHVCVAKNRKGPVGNTTLQFSGTTTTFS